MEKNHMEIILEDIQSKFELLVEGHVGLNERMDKLEENFESRAQQTERLMSSFHRETRTQIKAVADDLAAHRTDTESHNSYQVRENPDNGSPVL